MYQYGKSRNESEVTAVFDRALGSGNDNGCVYALGACRCEERSGEGKIYWTVKVMMSVSVHSKKIMVINVKFYEK